MPEQWRPINGAPHYEVSNRGRVRCLGHTRPHNRYPGKWMWWKEKLLKPARLSKTRHLFVILPPQRAHRVHRLVCYAFNGPPPFPDAVARHLDDNPINNVPENLAWGTQKDNMADAKRNGTRLGGYRPKGSKVTP